MFKSVQPKSRAISFRVSPHQYDALTRMAEQAGASSISEFVRERLTSSLFKGTALPPPAGDLRHEIESLKEKMWRLEAFVREASQ